MSSKDQEHFKKLAGLLPTEGRWRWVAMYLAVPTFIGTTIALFTYFAASVNFYNGVKMAINLTPYHARAIDSLSANVWSLYKTEHEDRDAIREIEDTLGIKRVP